MNEIIASMMAQFLATYLGSKTGRNCIVYLNQIRLCLYQGQRVVVISFPYLVDMPRQFIKAKPVYKKEDYLDADKCKMFNFLIAFPFKFNN